MDGVGSNGSSRKPKRVCRGEEGEKERERDDKHMYTCTFP
jgi:hypothetical protein